MSLSMGKQKDQVIEDPAAPTPIPTLDDAAVNARRNLAKREMRSRNGRRGTLLSSGPLGDQGARGYKPMLS